MERTTDLLSTIFCFYEINAATCSWICFSVSAGVTVGVDYAKSLVFIEADIDLFNIKIIVNIKIVFEIYFIFSTLRIADFFSILFII